MTTEPAAPSKGLFRALTRSKSKKKAAHAGSSSADGHQPPSLASWGQANTAAGAGLAGVGGVGAGGLGRATTLREKTRAQMGGAVPAMPMSTSSGSLAAAASGGGQARPVQRSPSQGQVAPPPQQQQQYPRPMERAPDRPQGADGRVRLPFPRWACHPPGPLASFSLLSPNPYSGSLALTSSPSPFAPRQSAYADHARQASDPSTYSASSSRRSQPSHQSHGPDDADADDGYGDLLDAYDDDGPRSPTSPVTPQPPAQQHHHQQQQRPRQPSLTAQARQGMQTITLRDGSTIETPLPPSAAAAQAPSEGPGAGDLPFHQQQQRAAQASAPAQGRARAKSVGRDQAPPPPSAFSNPPPLPSKAPSPPSAADRPPSQSSHSRLPTSASSLDSPMVATPLSDAHALPPPALAQYAGGPKAPTVSQGDLPQDRFVVSLGDEGSPAKKDDGGGGGSGWGKVKRGLTVRRKEVRRASSFLSSDPQTTGTDPFRLLPTHLHQKPALVSDRPPSPPRVGASARLLALRRPSLLADPPLTLPTAAAPTMYSAATLAMQMAAAERKAQRVRHDPNAIGGGALAGSNREEERLTESAFM